MEIKINDDFDLYKIAKSGQCFRVHQMEDGRFRFITGNHVVYIKKISEEKYYVSCLPSEWDIVWKKYFDLERSYAEIISSSKNKNYFVDKAIDYGRGIRILRQDPWEMLITSIATQRKNIPAIIKTVERLAQLFGHPITTEEETVFSFPTIQEMYEATDFNLNSCGLGYRTPYVQAAIRTVRSGRLNIQELEAYSDTSLLDTLCEIHGVGKKVASCVALFGYGRLSCVPIDVWINRAIEQDCNGESPFSLYGEFAGIIQQYIFYYEICHKAKQG